MFGLFVGIFIFFLSGRMCIVKKFVFLILLFVVLAFPYSAWADEGWVIPNFSSDLVVQKTGEVKVHEVIDADFGVLSKHGIYRDIPYVYQSGNDRVYTEVSVLSVRQNDGAAKYEVIKNDSNLRIKIGDAGRTVTGVNRYEIVYVARGVLRGFGSYDELFWNVTGNDWPVSILKVSSRVELPETGGVLRGVCYVGVMGSREECVSKVNKEVGGVSFSTVRALGDGEGMSVVVGYRAGMVPILTVERPISFVEKFFSWPSVMTVIIALGFGVVTVFYAWYRYGRDFWFGGGFVGDKVGTGGVKPIGGHETVVVEFGPPEKLRPGELGVVVDEVAHTHDVTATIVDLATRGFLKIKEVPKKWIFGNEDYILQKQAKSTDKLLSYEGKLFEKLFAGESEVSVSGLKTTFYKELREVKNDLYNDVVERKIFLTNPETVRTKFLASAFFVMAGGAVGLFLGVDREIVAVADFATGIVVSGLAMMLIARFMPRRSAYGREIYRRTLGYKLFIETAEKYRQKFFEKENMFNEILPYAIVFGVVERYANAMKEIGLKPETDWYSGVRAFNLVSFANSMNNFSNSLSQAMASAPSSSGFSGGGSSGGGFGGGGGGSW